MSSYLYEDIEQYIIQIDKKKEDILATLQDSETLRQRFVDYYRLEKLRDLPKEEYVLGLKESNDPTNFNFCLILEYKLIALGNSKGSRADKYGIYFDKEQKVYRTTKKYGSTVEEAYQNFKNLIIDLIEKGNSGNLKELIKNAISPNVKGKILALYYPNRYLNIFSYDHLTHFLKNTHIGNAENIKVNPILQREMLINYKNSHPLMKGWEMVVFTRFLYSTFPYNKKIGEIDTSEDQDDRLPLIPHNQEPEPINFEIIAPKFEEENLLNRPESNPDYIKKAKFQKRIGNAGEDVVFLFESKRIKPFKLIGKSIEKAQLDIDGYDFLSYEEDGTNRYIEVKTTIRRNGVVKFFLTANELEKAKRLSNYWIYFVFEVKSKKPKVWALQSPFISNHEQISIKPIQYSVAINTKS